jgi:hypothetical protein
VRSLELARYNLLMKRLIATGLIAAGFALAGCKTVTLHPPAPAEKWEFVVGKSDFRMAQFPQSPAIDTDGTIYVGGDHGVYALNPDGSKKWFRQATYEAHGSSVNFTVLDAAGNIWFDEITELGGAVSRIKPDGEAANDGSSLGGVSVTQLGAGYDATIFMGTTKQLMILDATGPVATFKWNRVGNFFALAPDNGFYTVSNSLAHYSPNGDLDWVDPLPLGCSPPALGTDGTIYLGCYGKVLAFNHDSTTKWSLDLAGQSHAPAIAADGTSYFGCGGRDVCSVSPDGHLNWKFETGGEVHSVPAIAKAGNIYFGSSDHKLYAVSATGKSKWEFATKDDVFSPTIADDDSIYVLSGDGVLHAIRDTSPNGGLSGQWPKVAGGLGNTTRGAAASGK